jgi:hypothetical protein
MPDLDEDEEWLKKWEAGTAKKKKDKEEEKGFWESFIEKVKQSEIENFKKEFLNMIANINETESEDHNKTLLRDFLNNIYYKNEYEINTYNDTKNKIRVDLAVKQKGNTFAEILIEVKNPTNKTEMPTINNLNKKALQELLLYYMSERVINENKKLRHLIITNMYEWFVFDATDFYKLFHEDNAFRKDFQQYSNKQLEGKATDYFYNKIALPQIDKLQNNIPFVYFNILDYKNLSVDNEKFIELHKFFSPVNLLKRDILLEPNQLNKEFYAELLHIIGLKEETKDGRKLIERANNTGSLIEEAISQIETDECKALSDLQYGEKHERAYNAAFRLVIIWINRILFLKLLEAQICKYHKGYKSYVFLSTDKLENYGDLNELFFSVLAVKTHERKPEHLKSTFANVPYLNSSLFEKADIEKDAIYIRALGNITHFTPYSKSVLHNENPPKSHLEYLLRFLDAYDFSSEGSGNVQEENKPLISASVLG